MGRVQRPLAKGVVLAICLAGCGAPGPDSAYDSAPKQSFTPFEGGLRVAPDGREISLGRDWAGVEDVLNIHLGAPRTRRTCGSFEVVTWGDLALRHDGQWFLGFGCP